MVTFVVGEKYEDPKGTNVESPQRRHLLIRVIIRNTRGKDYLMEM